MSETKKHYQGQRGGTPRKLCPKCDGILQIAYVRKTVNGKRAYVDIGYACPDCPHMERFEPEE